MPPPLKRSRVGEILRTSGRQLVPNQGAQTHVPHGDRPINAGDVFLESLVERHTADPGQDVDLIRGPPEFQRSSPGEPCIDIELLCGSAKAELLERRDEAARRSPVSPG